MQLGHTQEQTYRLTTQLTINNCTANRYVRAETTAIRTNTGLELSGGGLWGLNPPVYVYRRSFLSENRP